MCDPTGGTLPGDRATGIGRAGADVNVDVPVAFMLGVYARLIVAGRIDVHVCSVDVARGNGILRAFDPLARPGRVAAYSGLRLGGGHTENEREE